MRVDYPLPRPHGEIRQLMPDVFYLPGTVQIAPAATVNRNMVIIREGDDLTLVNPIRLRAQQEEKLQDLGNIRHAVRLGFCHGSDDLYYRDRFQLTFWCQRHSAIYPLPGGDAEIRENGACPLHEGKFVEFSHGRFPEAVLWLPRCGGLLLTCDALQYWMSWCGCSWCGKNLLRLQGFRRGMQVAPSWCRQMCAETVDGETMLYEDFQRVLALPFLHLMAAHGDFCPDSAHEQVERAVAQRFQRHRH